MSKTLTQRLDEACEKHELEWLVLPFEQNPVSWRNGPYWGALVKAQYQRRPGRASRFYRYRGDLQAPFFTDVRPNPKVTYITGEPCGRQEIKRLLLAQIEG